MASADSNFDDFFCSVFNLNDKNVNNALIARELSGFTLWPPAALKISSSLLVNSCR